LQQHKRTEHIRTYKIITITEEEEKEEEEEFVVVAAVAVSFPTKCTLYFLKCNVLIRKCNVLLRQMQRAVERNATCCWTRYLQLL